jgi:hypothetical protein
MIFLLVFIAIVLPNWRADALGRVARTTVGKTLRSCGAIPCDYINDIQAAIDSANHGDEIVIYEEVSIGCDKKARGESYLKVDKSLHFSGGTMDASITFDEACPGAKTLISVSASNVSFENIGIDSRDQSHDFTDVLLFSPGADTAAAAASDAIKDKIARYSSVMLEAASQTSVKDVVSGGSAAKLKSEFNENFTLKAVRFSHETMATNVRIARGKYFDIHIEACEFVSTSNTARRAALQFDDDVRLSGVKILKNAFEQTRVVVSEGAFKKNEPIDVTYNYWEPAPFKASTYNIKQTHLLEGMAKTTPYCVNKQCSAAGPLHDTADAKVGYGSFADYKLAHSAGKTASQKVNGIPQLCFTTDFFRVEATVVLDFPVNITSACDERTGAPTTFYVDNVINTPAFMVVSDSASFHSVNVALKSDEGGKSVGFAWYRPEKALSSSDLQYLTAGVDLISAEGREQLRRGYPLRVATQKSPFEISLVKIFSEANNKGDTYGLLVFSESASQIAKLHSVHMESLSHGLFLRWPQAEIVDSYFTGCKHGVVADLHKGSLLGNPGNQHWPSLTIENCMFEHSESTGIHVFSSDHCMQGASETALGTQAVVKVSHNVFIESRVVLANVASSPATSVMLYANDLSHHEAQQVDAESLDSVCLLIIESTGVVTKANNIVHCAYVASAKKLVSEEDTVKSGVFRAMYPRKSTTPCFNTVPRGGNELRELTGLLAFDLIADANIVNDLNLKTSESNMVWIDAAPEIESDSYFVLNRLHTGSQSPLEQIRVKRTTSSCGEINVMGATLNGLRDGTGIENRYQTLSLLSFNQYLNAESGNVAICGYENKVPLKFSRKTCECLPMESNEIYSEETMDKNTQTRARKIVQLADGVSANTLHTASDATKSKTIALENKASGSSKTVRPVVRKEGESTTKTTSTVQAAAKPTGAAASVTTSVVTRKENVLLRGEVAKATVNKGSVVADGKDSDSNALINVTKRNAQFGHRESREDDDDDNGHYHGHGVHHGHGGASTFLWIMLIFLAVGGIALLVGCLVWGTNQGPETMSSKSRKKKHYDDDSSSF